MIMELMLKQDINLPLFTQSVNDVTAGVYVTLNLQVTNNLGD